MTLVAEESGADSAATVVLLHGVGTSGWMWRRLATALSSDFHVLVPDLPGHGRSNHMRWTSLGDTAAQVAQLIRSRAASGRAHVVGLSLGGNVAVRLAVDEPDLVSTAIASGVNVLPYPNPRLMRLAGVAMAPVITTAPMLRANAKALGVPEEDFPGYRDAARAMSRRAFLRVGNELMTFGVPERANRFPRPMLAVAGSKEHELIRRSLPLLASAFPAGQARVVDGVGHGWVGEVPEVFEAMVRAHAANLPLPPQVSVAT